MKIRASRPEFSLKIHRVVVSSAKIVKAPRKSSRPRGDLQDPAKNLQNPGDDLQDPSEDLQDLCEDLQDPREEVNHWPRWCVWAPVLGGRLKKGGVYFGGRF